MLVLIICRYIWRGVCFFFFFFHVVQKCEERRSRPKQKQLVCSCGVTGEGSVIIQPIFASFFERKLKQRNFIHLFSFVVVCLALSLFRWTCCCLPHQCVFRICFENMNDKYMCKTLWRPDNTTPINPTKKKQQQQQRQQQQW